MRPDFYDRFSKFNIPPLYQRRTDILYYISYLFPDLLKRLKPWEIMTLLAYPWIGNVRELEAVCLDIELFQFQIAEIRGGGIDHYLDSEDSISYVKAENTGLNLRICTEHYANMKKAGIDVIFLERVLNKFGLGLDRFNKKKPFAKITKSSIPVWKKTEYEICNIKILDDVNEFRTAYFGLLVYCAFFYKDVFGTADLLSSGWRNNMQYLNYFHFHHIAKPTAKHEKLRKDIMEYVFKIKIPQDLRCMSLFSMDVAEYKGEYDEWVSQVLASSQGVNNPDGVVGTILNSSEPTVHPFEMKETDLLHAYYLYHKNKGLKVSEAARAVGHKRSTFVDNLRKANITPWR